MFAKSGVEVVDRKFLQKLSSTLITCVWVKQKALQTGGGGGGGGGLRQIRVRRIGALQFNVPHRIINKWVNSCQEKNNNFYFTQYIILMSF